mmetsp:Transcript_3391/g.7120  ORF Transcript_3391/g.7120 Transcript_3391/m.7120 type:complete len:278 (-) Transcript_3391:326-1159(-)
MGRSTRHGPGRGRAALRLGGGRGAARRGRLASRRARARGRRGGHPRLDGGLRRPQEDVLDGGCARGRGRGRRRGVGLVRAAQGRATGRPRQVPLTTRRVEHRRRTRRGGPHRPALGFRSRRRGYRTLPAAARGFGPLAQRRRLDAAAHGLRGRTSCCHRVPAQPRRLPRLPRRRRLHAASLRGRAAARAGVPPRRVSPRLELEHDRHIAARAWRGRTSLGPLPPRWSDRPKASAPKLRGHGRAGPGYLPPSCAVNGRTSLGHLRPSCAVTDGSCQGI